MIARIAIALVSGTLFGAGLAVGGMTDPNRVRGFLDLFGAWDPTLAFVMGGALIVMAVGWRLQVRTSKPLYTDDYCLPNSTELTPKLIIGSALFGIGWGIAGLCPGPGIAIFATSASDAALFCVALAAGMAIHHFAFENTKESTAHATE